MNFLDKIRYILKEMKPKKYYEKNYNSKGYSYGYSPSDLFIQCFIVYVPHFTHGKDCYSCINYNTDVTRSEYLYKGLTDLRESKNYQQIQLYRQIIEGLQCCIDKEFKFVFSITESVDTKNDIIDYQIRGIKHEKTN